MNRELVDKIVKAVLYEGYVLYPYRPSSVKNQCRWTFGGIYPCRYVEANPGVDACSMQCQCIVANADRAEISVNVRFLHLTMRTTQPSGQCWQEAVEREVPLEAFKLSEFCSQSIIHRFSFPGELKTEDDVVRERQLIEGSIELSAKRKGDCAYQLTIRIENQTPLSESDAANRDAALLRSLASTHTILNVKYGDFISLADPPSTLASLANQCRNQGCWPVLVGSPGDSDTLLASPIILYDYPQIAPESPGDLFDGTEIDEILSLRILTLTDEEKRQAAATDDRVRRMLARTESLARDQLANLHGAIRGMTKSEEAHA